MQAFSQPQPAVDTTKIKLRFKDYPWYVRTSPFSIYATRGKTQDRVAQWVELGKSFNIIDAGLAFGRNSFRPDSTLFAEGKVTMNVFNSGIFANEMTIGAGRVFDQHGSLMLELTYSIFAQFSKHGGVGLLTGYYDFSNQDFDYSYTFYGIFFRYGIQRTDSGGLLGVARGHGRPGRPGRGRHGR